MEELRSQYRLLPIQNTSAAAGSGCAFSDVEDIVHCFVKNSKLSKQADILVRVSGYSMEPAYNDGDIVFVKNTETGHEGDDLICSTVDGLVIKRMGAEGNLYSVNKDIPFGQKYEDDNVRIIGLVMGIVDPEDFANK